MHDLWLKLRSFLINLTYTQKRPRLNRYLFPLVVITVVLIIKYYFFNFFGEASAFLLLTFTVTLSAIYGGLGPGIFATILISIINFLTILTADLVVHPLYGDMLLTFIFIIEGLAISAMSEARFESEQQKNEFIGFAGHELKNPLSSIKGFAGLISSKIKNQRDKKIFLYSEEIIVQSDLLLDLINDLLDVTKIEIGKFSYKKEPFRIDDLVKEVVLSQRVIAKNRQIKFKGSTKGMVYGDKYRIRQLLVNLITNAIKYSPENKKVEVDVIRKNNHALIKVVDFGVGIKRDEQSRIFERFYRSEKAKKSAAEGLGLGLYISSQIAKEHGGNITLKSAENKGSIFSFAIPLQHG